MNTCKRLIEAEFFIKRCPFYISGEINEKRRGNHYIEIRNNFNY